MRTFFLKHTILRKWCVTFLIIWIFLLGKHISVPLVPIDVAVSFEQNALAMATVTGGDLAHISLFSLGLVPWMYASLLLQLFVFGTGRKSFSTKMLHTRLMVLMLLIAVIQGLALAFSIPLGDRQADWFFVAVVATILVAGSFVISWLGSINAQFGVGGYMMIMVVNIVMSQDRTVSRILGMWQDGHHLLVLGFLGWILVTIGVMTILEKSYYRIPIQRISIHNDYATESYLPLKVGIVGGLPLMYAYTFLVFPRYLLQVLGHLIPQWAGIEAYARYMETTHLFGIGLYSLIVLALSVSLALVMVDPLARAADMRKSGDYIPGIRPGRPTKVYLERYVCLFAAVNALCISILSGLPLVLALWKPQWQELASMIGSVIMFTGMSIIIIEEIRMMGLKKYYRSIF